MNPNRNADGALVVRAESASPALAQLRQLEALKSCLLDLEAQARRAAEEDERRRAEESRLSEPEQWSATLLRELESIVVKLGGVVDRVADRDLEALRGIGPVAGDLREARDSIVRAAEESRALHALDRQRVGELSLLAGLGLFWGGLGVGAAVVILGTVLPIGWPLSAGIVGLLAATQLVRLMSGGIWQRWTGKQPNRNENGTRTS
ncbi:MAG: hypothetical protein PHO89_01285 [Methylacidiphilaceae bacterium]|nr:hypothetical protein [Candidatus Methylacidiphilaceae bacterium]